MDATLMVNLLRRLRHDLGNHLQVIGGYTDLANPAAVKDYITQLTEKSAQEAIIYELDNPEVTLFLWVQMFLLQDLGVNLCYKELEISSGQRLRESNEPYNIIKTLIKEHEVQEEINMEISILETLLETKIEIFSPNLTENVLTFNLKE